MTTNNTNISVLEQDTQTASESWLRVPEEATLPEDIQALFKAQRDRYGFVHPYFVGYSLNPDHLRRWFHYYDALQHGKGELSHREREIIAVVVSATNHCESCVLTHQAQLREVTGDPTFAASVADNYWTANLTARERAIADFAVKLTTLLQNPSPDDLLPLRQVGLSDEAILEAGEIAAQFSLSNRLSKAFGWKVKREQYSL
jgi:uncharacterized peroxidase-related enzyme